MKAEKRQEEAKEKQLTGDSCFLFLSFLRYFRSCRVWAPIFQVLPGLSRFALQIQNNFNWLRTMRIKEKVLRVLSNHKVLWFS
jgi:hypothetical protein